MNEQLEEQASLYALDLLEPAELSAFEAKLAQEPELQRRVDQLRESAANLAHGAPSRKLPGHLEARVMDAIRAEKREAPPVTPAASGSMLNWLPWALAACLALGCAFLAADRARIRKEIARLEKRDVFAQMKIATLASQLESAPRANAVVIWDAERQEGVLKLANVPANETDRDYQLWIVDPDYKQPVDAGVFHLSEEGTTKISFKPKSRVTTANAFAVSLERKGGVSKAEGPMVLLGK